MSRFTLHKRNNPCPICESIKGNCKTSNKGVVLCHSFIDSDAGVPTWKWVKSDKSGVWGVFVPDDGLHEFDRDEWKRRLSQRDALQERKNQLLLATALDIPQRDRAIRKLHNYLGLGSKHRQNLCARGLTDAQIDAGYFFTIYPNLELPPGIPGNLPGVSWGKLATKTAGMACPAFDVEGRLIGWQLLVDEATDNKYRWAKGWKSSHLPNGELPITVCRPVDGVKHQGVRLSEGLLKPFIAAQKTGQICIGAAGGNHAGSPEQLKAALDKINPESVILDADAGAVANPHIIRQYRRTIDLVTGWGYAVNIGWWGQVDKSHPDIDELSGSEAIATITPEEFLALGAQYGGHTPSRKELDDQKERTISRDEWEVTFGFGKRLRNRIKQALESFKGFGQAPPQPRPHETPDKLFSANRRLQTWQDAVKEGYRYILDKSAPGLGKSHAAGIALPDAFDTEKLWYISADHRNPTTGVIESNYVDLPVRHNGLKIDDTRKTPNGNPFKVWPKAGEEPDTKGNCLKTDLFQKFRAKNLNVEASDSSPICTNCKVAHLCKSGSGRNYNASFRGDRKSALNANRIRAHADSLPSPIDFDYFTSGLFWDEVGTQFKSMDSVDVTLADFDQTWAELETKAPNLHEALKPLRLALRPLLTGDVKQPYHGWDDGSIRALLPSVPDNLSQIINELERVLKPDLSFLKNQPDSVRSSGQDISKGIHRLINRQFRRFVHEEFSDEFQKLALNWLVPLLKVWSGERGSFRCASTLLTIFTHSSRHASVARAAKFNVFLDATITREHLALLLEVEPNEIYVVEQETPNLGNLRILQVTGMGKLGKDRSESMQDRVAALKKALSERYPGGIAFGDWKTHAEAGDGQWFVNLRGSNEFQTTPTLAVFGVPYQNIGHLQALYQTLTGDSAPLDKQNPHEGLQRFIQAHVEAEIEQAVGRLRSHIRQEEQLTFIFVGDYDLGFLGMPVEQIEAFELCYEAGTPRQKTRWAIWQAYLQLRQQLKDPTDIGLNQLARLVGITKGRLSQIAHEFNGWAGLQRCLDLLFNSLYNNPKHPLMVNEDVYWLAKEYLPLVLELPPLEALLEVATLIRTQNIEGFKQILVAATLETKSKLLSAFGALMPMEVMSLPEAGGMGEGSRGMNTDGA
jgi:hypothetical protein